MTLLLLLSSWNVLHADKPPTLPKQCDPKDAHSCVQPLLAGEMAPFTGQLLTHRRAARLAVKSASCKARIQLKIDETAEVWKLKLDLEKGLRENDNIASRQSLEAMKRYAESLEQKWYEHPAFVVGVTIVAASLLTWGSIEAWSALSRRVQNQ